MNNQLEHVGQDIYIEPVNSLQCYLIINGSRVERFDGETCYMDAQRTGMDILMKRVYG